MRWVRPRHLVGALSLAWCVAAQAEDLAAIFREALLNNAQYRAAEAQYRAVRQRIPESAATLLPSVTLSANTLWNDNNSNTLGHQQYNSNGYTATLIQPVWRSQNTIALHEARSMAEQASAQLDLARQDLLIHTAQAYFDVLFAEDAVKSLSEERAADQKLLEQASRSFDIGAAAVTDLNDAQARYDLVLAHEMNASNEVESKRQVLRQIIDHDPGTIVPLRAGIVIRSPMPDTVGPWEEAAQSSNPVVIAAEAALEAARLETKRARAAHFPTLDFVATHGISSSATDITVGTDLHANTVGFQVNVPIYSGGGVTAKVQEDKALADKADADLEDARRSGALAAQQAFLNSTSGLAQVRALERATKSAQVAVQSNQRGAAVGSRINIDVLAAQQQLSIAERDLAKARYDTLMALLHLKAAAGSVGAADIDEINALLAN